MEALFIVIPVIIVFVVILLILYADKKRQEDSLKEMEERHAHILAKYRDPKIAEMITKQMVWQGQTVEQLQDSLGKPADVDQKVLKTKTREIWKYHQTSSNRFGLRITVENNVVVGWDKKN